MKPKKNLGQHFLTDKNIANKIVACLSYQTTTKIKCLEIGPGKGVLTKLLLERNELDLSVIEIDNEAVEYLKFNIPEITKNIYEYDFLKFDLKKHFDFPLLLIGNFPYNISAPIFFKILENKNIITQVVCMIQKEVAERITSKPGTKKIGILSIILQAYFDIEYLFTVNENVFQPPPKVKSAVIRLKRKKNDYNIKNEAQFLQVVKTAYNQRRKMIRNSLKGNYDISKLSDSILTRRPEQLSVQDFVEISNVL